MTVATPGKARLKVFSELNAAFTASKFKKFLRNYDIEHTMTSSHHPEMEKLSV